MDYRYENDQLWQVELNETDLKDFHSPCLGNGIIGVRVAPTVFSNFNNNEYIFLSKQIFDKGKQLVLPAFNCLQITTNGTIYSLEKGKHTVNQCLDMRNATISLHDRWEYEHGKYIDLEVIMLVSRKYMNISFMGVSIKGAPEASTVMFGLNGNVEFVDKTMSCFYDTKIINPKYALEMNFQENIDNIQGNYITKGSRKRILQILKWDIKGKHTIKKQKIENGMSACCTFSGDIALNLYSSIDVDKDSRNVLTDLDCVVAKGRNNLVIQNRVEWKKLWDEALAFECGSLDTEKMVLLQQFHLLVSISCEVLPTSALGISSPGWTGGQLWDTDFWLFRAILPLWSKQARSIIDFRFKCLSTARKFAAKHGYKGAWYSWMTDDVGNSTVPEQYENEIHLGIWIAKAAYEYFMQTKDYNFLRETGYSLIKEIADFYVSWAILKEDGYYHFDNVLGPDEYISERGHSTCNDNFMINFGVKSVVKMAIELSKLLNKQINEEWEKIVQSIFLFSPDKSGVILEHAEYKGEEIKQADTILSFYPLNFEISTEIITNNIEYYHKKVGKTGPLMSGQIEALLYMKMGMKEKGLEYLFNDFKEFTRGKYQIPYETRDNNNSIMLTGIGGIIQALIFGYYDYEIGKGDCLPKIKEYIEK